MDFHIDSILNESVRENVKPITDFTQSELTEGAPVNEKTELRILHDRDNLYIFFPVAPCICGYSY